MRVDMDCCQAVVHWAGFVDKNSGIIEGNASENTLEQNILIILMDFGLNSSIVRFLR
jgi:hypothetical protein